MATVTSDALRTQADVPRRPYTLPMKLVVAGPFLAVSLGLISPVFAQAPTPTVVESASVKILTGLLAPQLQEEMNFMTQALGVTCNTCHVRGNFASEEKPEKLTARRMLEMTKGINQQFFPDHKPKSGESVLGRVTCYTCHQGERTPKLPPG